MRNFWPEFSQVVVKFCVRAFRRKAKDNEWVAEMVRDGIPRAIAVEADNYDGLAVKAVAKFYYEKVFPASPPEHIPQNGDTTNKKPDKNSQEGGNPGFLRKAVFWHEIITYKEHHEYINLGRCYEKLGKVDWAEKCFNWRTWFYGGDK